MVYLTNEQAQMLDGCLRDIASAVDDIQQARTASPAPIADYATAARALLAREMARGDKLASFNTDTPAVSALRSDVKAWVDGPVSAVRALLNVAGSLRSQGDCVAELVVGRVIQLVYPDAPAPDVVVEPVVAENKGA